MKEFIQRFIGFLVLLTIVLITVSEVKAQTVTVSPLTNGFSGNSTIAAGQTQVPIYEIKVQVSGGSVTFKQFSLTCSNTMLANMGNAVLYRSSSGTWGSGTFTPVGNVTLGSTTITMENFTETITNTSNYYFLAIDAINTVAGYSIQIINQYNANLATDVNNNNYGYPGYSANSYNFTAGAPYDITVSNQNAAGIILANNSTIINGTAAVKLFTFSVTNNSNSTINLKTFNINSNVSSIGSYFDTFKLYANTTNLFPVSSIANGTASTSYVGFTGLNETIASGATKYYWLVANSLLAASPANIQFSFGYNQATAPITTASKSYNDFNVLGYTYSLNSAIISMGGLTAGLSSTTVYPSQQNAAVFGFSLTATIGSAVINQININSDNNNLSSYYSNFKLYSNTTNDYSTGTKTLLQTVASASGNFINFNSLSASQTINSTPKYYFLVADVSYNGAGTNSTTFKFSPSQTSAALTGTTSSFNNFSVSGNAYNITQPTVSVTSNTNGVLANGPLTYGNTAIPVYGFNVAVTGSATLNSITITNGQSITLSNYFANAKLYRNSTNDYSTGTKTLVGTATVNAGDITVTGIADLVNNTTQYYFLVVDDIYYGTTGNFQPILTNVTYGGSTNPGIYQGYYSFTIPPPTIVLTGNNTVANGITQGVLQYNQTGIVLFGFKMDVTGTTTITQIAIPNTGVSSNYFSNGILYRSTTPNFSVANSTVVNTGTISWQSNYVSIPVNQSFSSYASPTTYYYFLVGDYTNKNASASGTLQYGFSTSQTPAALSLLGGTYQSPSTVTDGQIFNVGLTYDWAGGSNSFTTVTNYRNLNNGGVSTYPGLYDQLRIGVVPYANNSTQPSIAANTSISKLIFGNNNSPALSISNGRTLFLSDGVAVEAGATATVNNAGTLSLDATAVSTIPSGATLNFTNTAKLINNGTLNQAGTLSLASTFSNTGTVNQTGSLSVTGAGNNSGTINQIGTGTTTFSNTSTSSLNNSGTIALQGTGAFTVSGTLTNTGTISHSSSGDISLATVANNATGAITFGSGTNTISSTTSNVLGATLTTAGTTTFTGAVTNGGSLNQPATATTTFSSSLNNSGTIAQAGTLTITGAGTNSGTINQTGTGVTTFSSTGSTSLNNSGTIALQGTGTFTVAGTLTNTGTISHSSSGDISLAKITNNSPGGITFGSGTNTISGTTGIAAGATLTTAGTTTFTGVVTNAGTFNGGAANNTFNAAFSVSATTGIFDSGTATNNFNGAFTTSKTTTFSGGTSTFSSTFSNGSGGTVASTGGTVIFNGTNQAITNSNNGTAVNFNNLTLSNSGTKTLTGAGDFTTDGDLTIDNGVTLTYAASSGSSLNVGGGMTNNGTYTHNTTNTLTVGGTLTNNSGKTMTLGTGTTTLNGDLSNAGTITQGTGAFDFNGNSFTNSGTFTITSGANTFGGTSFNNTGTLNLGTGTITFDGTGTTSISTTPALNFNNITFSNGGTKTLTSGSFNIINTGALTMSGSTTLDANGNLTLKSDASSSASVKAIPTGASITGNVKVERFFTGGGTPAINNYRAYRLISSPVNNGLGSLSYLYTGGPGGTANGFSFTNPGTSTVFLYREDVATNTGSFNSGNYKGIAALNTNPFPVSTLSGTYSIYPGTGVMVYYVGSTASGVNYGTRTGTPAYFPAPDNTTTVSTGTLNQGDIPVKLWYNTGSTTLSYTTGIANTNDRGLILVGNPYASTIDWNTFSATVSSNGIYGPNVATTMYIYNYSTKTFGAYQVGGSGGKGTNNASRYIASGQGFFIKATGTGASLTFHESAKTTTQPNSLGASYLLMGVPDNTGNEQTLRLKLTQDDFNNEDILLSFEPNAADNYENSYDADHIKGVSNLVSLSSFAKNSGKQLSINHMHSIDSLTRVKLNFTANTTAIDTLAATGFETLDPRYDVYLLDHYKKDSLLISQYGKYYFNINPADTNSFGSTRFELVFHKKPSLANYQLLSFTGKKIDTGIQLTWKTKNETTFTGFTLQRADGSQQFLSLYSLQSDGNGNYTYVDQAPEKGINQYRLMQNDAFSRVSYSPIIAVDAQNVKVFEDNLIIYPNPVAGQLQVKISDGVTNSTKVNLTIMSAAGKFISSTEVDVNAIDENVSHLQTGSYIVQLTDTTTKKVIGRKKFIKL